jgi:hypothetical protein
MSEFLTLHQDMVDRLSGLVAFRGVVILSLDDHQYMERLNTALAQLHGVTVAIGNPSGTQAATNVPGGQFATTLRAYLFENQELNRNRIVPGAVMPSVADEAARLALTGLARGSKVFQMDVSKYFWLMHAGGEAEAQNWAELLVATELLQRVIRALHLWHPAGHQSLVCAGFEPGTLEDLHDYVIRFNLHVGLDPTALT